MTSINVQLGTIVFFSDLTCPFAHVSMSRLHRYRTEMDLEDQVVIDHHAFAIELLNASPGTRHGSDSEIPVLGAIEPDAGWQLWQGPDYHYPNSVLLAFEAVQAAKASGLRASEQLDRALRHAFWAESCPIQLHHEILRIAETVEGLDTARLAEDLRTGRCREMIFADSAIVQSGAVSMSPHLFLPDGSDVANPGVEVRWQGEWAKGFPVVDRDDPEVYRTILSTAASSIPDADSTDRPV